MNPPRRQIRLSAEVTGLPGGGASLARRGGLRVELGERLGGAELPWVELACGPGLSGGWVGRCPAEQGRRAGGWAGDDVPGGAVPVLDEGRWDAAAVVGLPHGPD